MYNANDLLIPSPKEYEEIPSSEWQSIYIPVFSSNLHFNGKPLATAESLTDLCENYLYLGKIERVDIATRPSGNAHVTCAFVHFSHWDGRSAYLRERISSEDQFGTPFRVNTVGPYRIYDITTNQTRYITLKVNKTPIEKVSPLAVEQMNIHQLVDNYKRLEKKNDDLEAKIADLESKLQKANALIEEFQHEVYDDYEDDCDCEVPCSSLGYPMCWEKEQLRRVANGLNRFDCTGDPENCAIFCSNGYCRLCL